MAVTLTEAEQAIAKSLGWSDETFALAQSAQVRKNKAEARTTFGALAKDKLSASLEELILSDGFEVSESAKSAWVGATISFNVEGFSVKVVLTDTVASDARKPLFPKA